MIRTFIVATLLAGIFGLGCVAAIFITDRPFVSSVDLGQESADAKASFKSCQLYGVWPVELKKGQPLLLEQRICPVGFHYDEDDRDAAGLRNGIGHEVLLLEDRKLGRVRILAALFSDLKLTRVEVGKTLDNTDAVLWSYDIVCGSCHGGPDGVLTWSKNENSYVWNQKWLGSFQAVLDAMLPEDGYVDNAPNLTWNNDGHSLDWIQKVYGGKDANCCPSAGAVEARFAISDGELYIVKDGLFFQRTSK